MTPDSGPQPWGSRIDNTSPATRLIVDRGVTFGGPRNQTLSFCWPTSERAVAVGPVELGGPDR